MTQRKTSTCWQEVMYQILAAFVIMMILYEGL